MSEADFRAGWDAFRDTLKPRIFEAKKPFEIADAVQIINTHHFARYAPPHSDRGGTPPKPLFENT